jgi:hypothetical protein
MRTNRRDREREREREREKERKREREQIKTLWVHDRSKCTPMSLHLKKPPEEQRGQEKV